MTNAAYYKFPAINLIKKYDPNIDDGTLAEVFAVNLSTIYRWRYENICLSPYEADRHAIRLGMHPSECWSDWLEPFETIKERRERQRQERKERTREPRQTE